MQDILFMNGRKFKCNDLGGGSVELTRGDDPYKVTVKWNDIFKWQSGEYIQDAMPYLTAEEREFLISGLTPTQWAAIFGAGDEEVEDGFQES